MGAVVELDPNEIAAKVVLASFERGVATVGKTFDHIYDSLSIQLKAGYRKYKKRSGENYGYVRTLLHRDHQIPIRDLYVATSFQHGNTVITDQKLIEIVAAPCKILVQGTAGGGKSVFLRLLNLAAAESSAKVLPIFIELKSLNHKDGKSIKDLASEYLKENGLDYSENGIKNLVDNGRVLFILDGFDEINHELREKYAREISDICRLHVNASVVVSSRPDEMVSSVERLDVYRVMPFDRDQAIELLGKLPYDETVRAKFISEITPEFFQKHSDFLSIPLLVTMMLMTYHQFAEIPSKSYLIYENAFATLFSWHDSSKDVFKRKSYTNLPMDEFKRVFSYFCFDSYIDQRFQFAETDVLSRIESAIEAEVVTSEKSQFLKDLLVSVCLMQRDGLNVTFVHRSFQEYFAAFYITRLDDQSARAALESAGKRVMSDLVFPMVEAMSPALFERSWALPIVKSLNKKIKSIDTNRAPFTFFNIFFETFSVGERGMTLTYKSSMWGSRLLSLSKIYGRSLGLDREASMKRIENFYEQLKNCQQLRDDIEHHSGVKVTSEVITDQNFSCPVNRAPDALEEHLKVSIWANAEAAWLRDLETELQARVSSRGTSFRTALAKRSRR